MALDPDLLLLRDDGEEEFGVSGGSGSLGSGSLGLAVVVFLLGSGSQPS